MKYTKRHFIRLLDWCYEVVYNPEMIEAPNYTRHYLGFVGSISQKELDDLCDLFNNHILDQEESFRITNHMGEIIPCRIKE